MRYFKIQMMMTITAFVSQFFFLAAASAQRMHDESEIIVDQDITQQLFCDFRASVGIFEEDGKNDPELSRIPSGSNNSIFIFTYSALKEHQDIHRFKIKRKVIGSETQNCLSIGLNGKSEIIRVGWKLRMRCGSDSLIFIDLSKKKVQIYDPDLQLENYQTSLSISLGSCVWLER